MMQLQCGSCPGPTPLGEPSLPSLNPGIVSGLRIIGVLIVLGGILSIANWSMKRRDARRYN